MNNEANSELDDILELARVYKMTMAERSKCNPGFAYGNVAIHKPKPSLAMIELGFDRIADV